MEELLMPPGFSKRSIVFFIAFLLQIIAGSLQTSYAARLTAQELHQNTTHDRVIAADLLHIDGPSSPWRSSHSTPESAVAALRHRDATRLAVIRSRMHIPARSRTSDDDKSAQVDLATSDPAAGHKHLLRTRSNGLHKNDDDDIRTEQNTTSELATIDPNGESHNPEGKAETGPFGSYYMSLSMGTPRRSQLFLIDSGTQLTWVRCKPCISCKNDAFDPAQSSSLSWTPCVSNYCKIRDYPSSCTSQGLCAYEQHNEGMAPTLGHLAQETFYLQNTNINDVVFGCSLDDQHTPAESMAGGVLGIGNGPFSFMSQLHQQVFYCLPPRQNSTRNPDPPGFLGFGNIQVPGGTIFTNLLTSPIYPDAHYVPLVGIRVNGTAVELNYTDFVMKPGGEDGVVLDSGTTITQLAPLAYEALQLAFDVVTLDIITTRATGGFENCFSFPNGFQPELIPPIDLIFDRGQNLTIPPENIMIQVSDTTYCFAFARSPLPVNILGTYQLSGFLVLIDTVTSTLGFKAKQCDEFQQTNF